MQVIKLTLLLIFSIILSANLLAQVTKQGATSDSLPVKNKVNIESNDSRNLKTKVYIIPITKTIGEPNLFILRRGLKEAIENKVEMVLLTMDTPGGRVDITIEMMEMLAKFDGITATYINDDAISAGSFVSAATQEIYFSPSGKMGASAVIDGSGQDVPETARLKIESYLRANLRTITSKYPYRSEVMRAMLDADYELVIEGQVIKPAGELLTLTAREAIKQYGNPAQPLLGKGIYESTEELLDSRFGTGNYETINFEVTYSERIAKWMETFAPALLGIGLLLLLFEFKTPGFGIFGILGIITIAVFFISQHIAGLAGHEEILFFALGIALVLVELFFFPGLLVFLLSGIALILGSILWAMIDFWPDLEPMATLIYGLSIALLGALILGRFFKGSMFDKLLVLNASVGSLEKVETEKNTDSLPAAGTLGTTVTDLFPSGRIEIDDQRYEARSHLGQIKKGSQIRVKKISRFGIVVEEAE